MFREKIVPSSCVFVLFQMETPPPDLIISQAEHTKE